MIINIDYDDDHGFDDGYVESSFFHWPPLSIFKMMLIMIIMIMLPSEEIFVFGHCTALSTWRDFLRIYVYIPNALQ